MTSNDDDMDEAELLRMARQWLVIHFGDVAEEVVENLASELGHIYHRGVIDARFREGT